MAAPKVTTEAADRAAADRALFAVRSFSRGAIALIMAQEGYESNDGLIAAVELLARSIREAEAA